MTPLKPIEKARKKNCGPRQSLFISGNLGIVPIVQVRHSSHCIPEEISSSLLTKFGSGELQDCIAILFVGNCRVRSGIRELAIRTSELVSPIVNKSNGLCTSLPVKRCRRRSPKRNPTVRVRRYSESIEGCHDVMPSLSSANSELDKREQRRDLSHPRKSRLHSLMLMQHQRNQRLLLDSDISCHTDGYRNDNADQRLIILDPGGQGPFCGTDPYSPSYKQSAQGHKGLQYKVIPFDHRGVSEIRGVLQ